MRLSPLDVLFTAPHYGGADIALTFDRPLDFERLNAALETLVSLKPVLGMRVDYSAAETRLVASPKPPSVVLAHRESLVDEGDPRGFLPYLRRAHSGDETLVNLTLIRTPAASQLVVSFAHVLGDGTSLFLFLATLGQLYGGAHAVAWETDRSCVDRAADTYAASVDTMSPFDLGFTEVAEFASKDERDIVRDPLEPVEPAQISATQSASTSHRLSTFDVVSALVLRKKALESKHDELTLICPVNLRSLVPEIPFFYFGNAVKGEITSFGTAWLRTAELVRIAERVNETKKGVTREKFACAAKLLRRLRAEGGDDALRKLRVTNDRSVLITDLTKAPEVLDFGAAKSRSFVMLSAYPHTAAIVRHGSGVAFQTARLAS